MSHPYPCFSVERETPAWLEAGRTQFQNEHGGPAEVAKGVLTQGTIAGFHFADFMEAGNIFFGGITPSVVWDWANRYSDALLDEMQALGKDLIQVTWSCGFSTAAEAIQRRIVTEFTRKAHQRNMRICAYLSLTNIFWKEAFQQEPFLREFVACYSNGDPVLYGYAQARYLACVNRAGWLNYLKRKMRLAITEAEVDAVYFDNLNAPCACERCRELFAEFCEARVGQRFEVPHLYQRYPPKTLERQEMEVRLAEETQRAALGTEEERCRNYLHRRFMAWRVALALRELRADAFSVRHPFVFAANNHLEPFINDVCNVIYSQDTVLPGPEQTNIPYLRYLAADAEGWKPVVTNHPCPADHDPRLSMAEAFAFQSYPYCITFKPYNLFYAQHPEFYTDVVPMAKIGVVLEYPKRRSNYLQPLGLANLLYEVIIPDKWDRVDLSKFKVILVPDPEAVGDDLLAALRVFEKNGGVLIATGNGCGFDAFARRRAEVAIPQVPEPLEACLPGDIVERIKTSAAPHYVSVQAPCGVVVNLMQKNRHNKWVLHVLNYSSQPVPELMIQCQWPGLTDENAVCHSPDESASRPLPFEAGGWLRLSDLKVYAVVVIECGEKRKKS